MNVHSNSIHNITQSSALNYRKVFIFRALNTNQSHLIHSLGNISIIPLKSPPIPFASQSPTGAVCTTRSLLRAAQCSANNLNDKRSFSHITRGVYNICGEKVAGAIVYIMVYRLPLTLERESRADAPRVSPGLTGARL